MWDAQKIMMLQLNLWKKSRAFKTFYSYKALLGKIPSCLRNGAHTATCQSLAADVVVHRQAQNASALEVTANKTQHRKGKLGSDQRILAQSLFLLKRKEPEAKVRNVRRDLLETPGCVPGTMSHNILWITKFADCTIVVIIIFTD